MQKAMISMFLGHTALLQCVQIYHLPPLVSQRSDMGLVSVCRCSHSKSCLEENI